MLARVQQLLPREAGYLRRQLGRRIVPIEADGLDEEGFAFRKTGRKSGE